MDYDLKRPLNTLFSAGEQFQKYSNIKSELMYGDLSKAAPAFTVLIPTFRRSIQLVEAVQSALDQTIDPSKYEVLIIDNEYDRCSVSLEMVRMLKTDNLFYYQNKQNLGVFGNWNRGFELARTEWICMLHDDDILYPHALAAIEAMLMLVDRNKTAALSPDFDIAEHVNGKWVCRARPPLHFWRKALQNRLILRSMLRLQLGLRDDPIAPTCGTALNRQAVLSVGGFHDQYKSEDLYLLYSLSTRYLCYTTKQIWGQYRWGNNLSLDDATKVGLLKDILMENDYFLKFPQKGFISGIERWFRKRVKYLWCIAPFFKQLDSELRDSFIASYFAEWKDYVPTRYEKMAFKLRSLLPRVYDIIATFLSKKDSNYVKS